MMAPDSGIWRTRFEEKYDLARDRTSRELKPEYQTRAIVLPRKLDFKQAENEQQKVWLEVIQTMVKESITLPVQIEISKTYEKIREVMTQVEFLSHPRRNTPSDMFCAVQLVRLLNQSRRKSLLTISLPLVPDAHFSRPDGNSSLWSIRLRHRHSVFFPGEYRWSIHQPRRV